MMFVTTSIGVTVVFFIMALLIQRKRKYSKLPPGPAPLPLIGNFHQIRESSMALDLTEIGKKYGDIFTVHLLMTPFVILNSHQVITDLLMSHNYGEIFSGRVSNYFSEYLLPHDMVFQTRNNGQENMRRIVMRGIKQYGTHLKRVELIAQQELRRLVDAISKSKGDAIDPLPAINNYTSNIILILAAGKGVHADHEIMRTVREIAVDFGYLYNYKNQILLDNVPFASVLHPGLRKVSQRMISNNERFSNLVSKLKKEMEDQHQESFLSLLEEEHRNGNISRDNVNGILLDILVTGAFTTTTAIHLIFLAMAQFPEVQRKVQQEIHSVVQSDKLPTLDDKPNLPYTQATILEIYRYFTNVPIPGPRTVTKDCTYRGYFFPKDTMITYNVWHMNHDENFWVNPFKFDPTRFLDAEGNLVPPEDERQQRMMTFGVGKRSCVGETLARLRVFQVLTAILQNFDLQEDPRYPLPSSDPRTYHVQFLTVAPPYKLCFLPTKNRPQTG